MNCSWALSPRSFERCCVYFSDGAHPSHTRISFAFVFIILGLTALYGYEFIIKLFQSLNANVAALKSRSLSYIHTHEPAHDSRCGWCWRAYICQTPQMATLHNFSTLSNIIIFAYANRLSVQCTWFPTSGL